MEPQSIPVAQLNVGDNVVMETGEQRKIKEIGRGFYNDSRLIELGRDNGKDVWACLPRTETASN
jgi:hypothetical protein